MREAFTVEKDVPNEMAVGSRCTHCDKVVKDVHIGATLLSKHLFRCNKVYTPLAKLAWRLCAALRRAYPEPCDPASRQAAGKVQKTAPVPLAKAMASREAVDPTAGGAPDSSMRQLVLSNYADRVTAAEVERIRDRLVNFFVSNNIAFAVAASDEFKGLVKALCPVFLNTAGMQTRMYLAGLPLDFFYGQKSEGTRVQ